MCEPTTQHYEAIFNGQQSCVATCSLATLSFQNISNVRGNAVKRKPDLKREFRSDAEWKVHRMENAFLVDDMLNLLQLHDLLTNARQHHC